jgi:exodeoxyribonuclease V alpha subunit
MKVRVGDRVIQKKNDYNREVRAKQLAIIVGQQKAIALAVRQVKDQQRYTLLNQRLNLDG